jgi:hypothetical protein
MTFRLKLAEGTKIHSAYEKVFAKDYELTDEIRRQCPVTAKTLIQRDSSTLTLAELLKMHNELDSFTLARFGKGIRDENAIYLKTVVHYCLEIQKPAQVVYRDA